MSAVDGWCEGCFRHLDEIAGWGRLGDDSKRVIWRLIEQRAGLLVPAHPHGRSEDGA